MATAGSIRAARAHVELSLLDRVDQGLASVRRKMEGFSRSVANIGARALGVGVAGAAVFIPTLRAASDAAEQLNAFNAVFLSQASAANQWAQQTAQAINRPTQLVREGLIPFQAFFKGLGFTGDAADQMSRQLVGMSFDLASFRNVADEEMFGRFLAAMSGSSEVLDQFGINIKAAAIEEELLRQGIKKTAAQATEQEKVLARIAIISRALGAQGALGDAAKTSTSFANQIKGASGAVTDLSVAIGNQLLPVVTPVVRQFTEAVRAMVPFVENNRDLVLTVAASAAGLSALGGTLLTVGAASRVAAFAFAGWGPLAGILKPVQFALTGIVGQLISMRRITGTLGPLLRPLINVGGIGRSIAGAGARGFGAVSRGAGTVGGAASAGIATATAAGMNLLAGSARLAGNVLRTVTGPALIGVSGAGRVAALGLGGVRDLLVNAGSMFAIFSTAASGSAAHLTRLGTAGSRSLITLGRATTDLAVMAGGSLARLGAGGTLAALSGMNSLFGLAAGSGRTLAENAQRVANGLFGIGVRADLTARRLLTMSRSATLAGLAMTKSGLMGIGSSAMSGTKSLLSGLGSGLGGLISMIGRGGLGALRLIPMALAAATSPLALIVGGTTALVSLILYANGGIGAITGGIQGLAGMFAGLGTAAASVFGSWQTTGVTAWNAITTAVGNGDLTTAVEVALAAINLMWTTAVDGLSAYWAPFVAGIEAAWAASLNVIKAGFEPLRTGWSATIGDMDDQWSALMEFLGLSSAEAGRSVQITWADLTAGMATVITNVWFGIQSTWESVIGSLRSGWASFTSFMASKFLTVGGWIEKAVIRFKALFDDDINVQAEIDRIDRETRQATDISDGIGGDKNAAINAERDKRLAEIEKQRSGIADEIDQERERRRVPELARRQELIQQARQDNLAAQQEFQAAVNQAVPPPSLSNQPSAKPGANGVDQNRLMALMSTMSKAQFRRELDTTSGITDAQKATLLAAYDAERGSRNVDRLQKRSNERLQIGDIKSESTGTFAAAVAGRGFGGPMVSLQTLPKKVEMTNDLLADLIAAVRDGGAV